MSLTFISLFAGIEGFGAGFESAGMKCVGQVEIDPQCRNVLARHYPGVERFTDVQDFSAASTAIRPDLICGGFPCQDLSVAGKRAGLAGGRSGLWFEFRRILAEFAPGLVCIENVPGLLSSNRGRDMGTVLGGLGQLGYRWAYRVLDAQYFGVAQRRERVFIVGSLGGWPHPAEILFDAASLPGNSPPSREARPRVAASLTAGTASGSGVNRPGRRREDDVNLIAFRDNMGGNDGAIYSDGSTATVTAECQPAVAYLRSVGVDVRECPDNGTDQGDVVPRWHVGDSCVNSDGIADIAHTLRAEGHDASEDGTGRGTPLIAWSERTRDGDPLLEPERDDLFPYLKSGTQRQQGVGVRRLTPRECEWLQGFETDWTRWGADGKEISDSARYRMLGNAVNVAVSRWLGRRIVEATKERV